MTPPDATNTRATPPSQVFPIREMARAKVNLTLHVKGKRSDGYHELESLVVFADFGDSVIFDPQVAYDMTMDGPFAQAIDGDNLVLKAKRAVEEWLKQNIRGGFHLEKNIPVAAGLGGGSSDAAAVVRALFKFHGLDQISDLEAFIPTAARIGADVPVCLRQKAAWMRGIGERVDVIETIESLPTLLVNPGIKLSTRDVFQKLNAAPYRAEENIRTAPPIHVGWKDASSAAQALAAGRNDLEPPAIALQPAIGDVLDIVRTLDGCVLSRLSGSGPTCFGIFETTDHAKRAELEVRTKFPQWWAQATRLS